MAETPAPRQKDLRELLRESVNATAVNVAKTGFDAIDHLARQGHQRLKDIGIEVSPDLTEKAVFNLKGLIVRAMGGQKQ